MRKTLLLLNVVVVLIVFSCQNEIDNLDPPEQSGEELDTIINIDIPMLSSCMDDVTYFSTCDSYMNPDDEKYCDPTFIGQFQFSKTSIDLANVFCDQYTETTQLTSVIGDTISLEVLNQLHYFSKKTNWLTKPCESDTSKYLLQCYDTEGYRVSFEIKELGVEFYVNIFIKTRFNIFNEILNYDGLEIWEKISNTSYSSRMKVAINSEDSQIDVEDPGFFHDTLELNNILYTDVYDHKNLTSSSGPINKYYLTISQGIIAIKTEAGTVYTLVE